MARKLFDVSRALSFRAAAVTRKKKNASVMRVSERKKPSARARKVAAPPPPPPPEPELDPAAALMLQRLARERVRRISLNRLNAYSPYAKQREFHEGGVLYRERAMMAANQVGKTTAGAAEAAMHLTGRYPDWWRGRVFADPVRALAGSESAELTRDGVQRLLIGPPRDESSWGTGMVPKECLVNWTRRNGVSDALDGVLIRWGGDGDVQAQHSSLNFKSLRPGPRQVAGRHIALGVVR